MLVNTLLQILITFKVLIIVSGSGLCPEYSTQHILALLQFVLSPCEFYVRTIYNMNLKQLVHGPHVQLNA